MELTSIVRPRGATRSRGLWLALAAVGAVLSLHALESTGSATPPARAGQVSLTATSGSGSAALGDTVKQIRWVGTYQPAEVDAATEYTQEIRFDASQGYVRGSITAPPTFKREWLFNNAWTATEPADAALIGGVRVSHKPVPAPPIGGAANFSGGGDGFAVSRYKGKLYIVNHHWTGNALKCVDPTSGGSACPGMDGGVYVPLRAGQPFAKTGSEYVTSHRSYQLVYRGKMYFPVSRVNGNQGGILCADLDTNTSCGFTPMSQNSYRDIDILGLGHWDNKLYAAIPGQQISCFDVTTGKLCWPSPRAINGANANYERVSPFIHDGYMMAVVQTGQMSGSSPSGMWCFNLRTGQGCGGNWFVIGASRANIIPILTETGRLRGACFSDPGSCFDVNAQPIGRPGNLPMSGASVFGTYVTPGFYIQRDSRGQVVHARTYIGDYNNGVDTIRCYDWATGSNCGTVSESRILTYTISEDQELPGCMWVIGDTARGIPFDAVTMGRCSQRTITMTINEKPADHYTFDPHVERDIKWSKVVINSAWRWGVDINSADPEAVTVSIYDKDQSRPFSVRVIPSGKYSVDISDISYAEHPELTVVVRIQRPLGAGAPPSEAGALVLWNGPPRQFSVRTHVNASACSVDGTTRGVTRLAGQSAPFDVQTAAANTLVRGASPRGFGQLAIETGLFDLRDSRGRATPVRFSTTFNELTQSGDVVADQLIPDATNSGSFTQQRIASAAALFLNPNERRITSTLLAGPDAVSQVNYTWDAISQGSYVASRMNTGALLTLDNLGPQRLAYIRGNRSGEGSNGFRVRTLPAGANHPLGMFVGSGVSLLPTKPMSGMSDFEAPGFGAFFNLANRERPVIFASGNDGMVHGYAVSANAERTGLVMNEAFAHIPRRINVRLNSYVNRSTSQLTWDPFYLDATPMLADVDASTRDTKGGSGWRTMLIGAFGRGAPGLFALDVTRADKGNVRSLFEMWDSDDDPALAASRQNPDMRHLGYIVSPPISSATYASYSGQVVKVKASNPAGYRWAYLTGNGYFSKSGRAALFIVYLDGAPGAKLEYQMILLPESAPGSGPNGLSTPRPVTSVAKGAGQIVEAVYAGDLRGNLWKIDISDPARAATLNAGIVPLFSDPAGRSIISAPVVTHQRQGRIVNFATGDANITPLRYASQKTNHAVYGVLDASSGAAVPTSTIASTSLVTHTVAGLDVDGQTYRTIRWNTVDLTKSKGWTFALPEREAVVANPILHPAADEVIFTSVQAPGNATGACIPGGSWEYRIAPATGRVSTLGFGLSNPAVAGVPAGSRSTGTTVSPTGAVVQSGSASRPTSTLATPPNRGRIWWREVAQ